MRKKLLSLGAIAMDIVLNSHDLPKDDGFALIQSEKMLPGGTLDRVLEWMYIRLEKSGTMRREENF